MTAFAAGLAGSAAPASMCANGEHAIDPVSPHAIVTNREAGCAKINITCLGKTDDPGTTDATSTSAGCSAAGSPGLLVLGAFALRRRRRRRRRMLAR